MDNPEGGSLTKEEEEESPKGERTLRRTSHGGKLQGGISEGETPKEGTSKGESPKEEEEESPTVTTNGKALRNAFLNGA